MEKQLLKKSGIIAAIVTFVALAFWFGFAKISLGIDTSGWTKYGLKKDSVIDEQIIILAGTNGSRIVFGTTTGKWVGTPTDSTLASIGLNTGTGKFEIKNAGTDTASPIVKYHGDLSGVTANQHHAQVHGAADHSGSIGTESQITFGTGSGHAHTGTDSTKVNYPNLLNRSHGAADHSGNIGTESQITFGTGSGHAHTGTDSTKVSYPNLLNRSHGAADHTGNIGAESQITFGTGSGHAHNGIDSTKIDYDLAPVQLGTDTTGSSDNISEGSTNKYYTNVRVNAAVGSTTLASLSDTQNAGTATDGQFLKKVGNKWQGASSSVTTYWSDILGNPVSGTSASAYISSIPLANKIPYSLNGNLDSWFSGLINTITLPATTTAQVGSTTASKVYVSSSQIPGIPDTSMHANTKLMLRMNGTNTSQLFTDSSTNNYTITRYGNTYQSTSVYKFGNASGYFDGVDDALSAADALNFDAESGDYTIRGWIYPISLSYQNFMWHGASGDNFWNLQVNTNYGVRFALQSGSAVSIDGDNALNINAWNHFAMTKTGTTYRVYINGNAGESVVSAISWGDFGDTLLIGTHRNGSADTNAYFDNIELIKGTALYTGTFTVPTADITLGTSTRYSTKVIAPGGGPNPQVLLEMQTWDTTGGTAEENSYASGTLTVNYFPGSLTVFGAGTPLGTSTLHTIHANGGILSNLGHFTLCFDRIKVITDDNKASLRSKYLDSFYDIKVKESYARKGNIPWIAATDIAKRQYKQEKYQVWKSANIDKSKYYVDEFLPGSGTIVQSFQAGAFETDYNNYIEGEWASDLIQNDYVQDVKDEQDMDKTRRMLRASLSDPSTPAIIKAPDGSALSLDDQMALAVMVIQEQNERLIATSQQLGSVTAEIEALKVLLGK